MNATNNNDITAIPEFTNAIFFVLFHRVFFRGLEKNLDDLLRFILDTIWNDINENMVENNRISDNYSLKTLKINFL